jgi:tetratricopeptide (TPR) repeat protein
MGVTYKKSKDYKNAAACFEKAIELDTLFKLNAYNNLYDIALETKDSVNLVKYHELAKQSNNTRIDKYMQIAIGYMNRHIWDSSLAAYRIALENRLDIKSQYHDMLVFSYVSCSNLPEQQNNIMTLLNNNLSGVDFSRYDTLAFKKSLAYDLDLALNYSRIGFCLAKLEKYDEALIFLKQAYNIHPTYDDVSENIKYIENLLKSNTMSNLENK